MPLPEDRPAIADPGAASGDTAPGRADVALRRRTVLAGGAATIAAAPIRLATVLALPSLGLAACDSGLPGRSGRASGPWPGDWVGASAERGHLLRDGLPAAARGQAPLQRRAAVLVVGGGIAGLACARALRQRGIDDVQVLELEDHAGGNSRGHVLGGMACPLGAHYLPLPDPRDEPLIGLLTEVGLARQERGRTVYDERNLCHSPQERLFIGPHDDDHSWHDGLLPPIEALPEDERTQTLADYRRYATLVGDWVKRRAFAVPTARAAWTDELAALDAVPFARWLDDAGLHSPALRWYLDYCCRDDFGAGIARVSAWAGLHYFASRHGFHAPGEAADEESGLLTWPEGNGWLAARLAAPLGDRLLAGRVVQRVDEGRHEVTVDAWDARAGRAERWTARQVVLAVPLFIAARLCAQPSAALTAAAAAVPHAPWLVANLLLDDALRDLPGAPPSWDNVVYSSPALGYVDAMHQSTRPYAAETVLTLYWALGGDDAAQERAARQSLLRDDHATWTTRVVAEMDGPHPDLRRHLRRVDLMRYGHAMAIPAPGVRGHPALRALQGTVAGRVHLAHADLSAYSVFEEAFGQGQRVGSSLAV